MSIMEKLELHHISPYLPYKIAVKYFGIVNGNELSEWDKENKSLDFFFGNPETHKPDEILDWKLGFIKKTETYLNFWKLRVGNGHKNIYRDDFGKTAFLVLRPLSDLAKEVEHISYTKQLEPDLLKIKPNELFKKHWHLTIREDGLFSINNGDGTCTGFKYMSSRYDVLLLLFEWHFDVFGLIEKGLAIDINTLDNGRG